MQFHIYEQKEKKQASVLTPLKSFGQKKTEAGRCQKNDWHLSPSTAKSTSVQQRR